MVYITITCTIYYVWVNLYNFMYDTLLLYMKLVVSLGSMQALVHSVLWSRVPVTFITPSRWWFLKCGLEGRKWNISQPHVCSTIGMSNLAQRQALAKAFWCQCFIKSTCNVNYADDKELGNWRNVMPMATMLQCNYVQIIHAYNDWTCKACPHVHGLVYACQLVGHRQMHNYINYTYIMLIEMLTIACICMQ